MKSSLKSLRQIDPEDLVGSEWAEWYRMTLAQRWLESGELWESFLALGGSLDPEPDTQSPFFDAYAPRQGATSWEIKRACRTAPLNSGGMWISRF